MLIIRKVFKMSVFGIITLYCLGITTGILISIIVIYNIYEEDSDE